MYTKTAEVTHQYKLKTNNNKNETKQDKTDETWKEQ